ncbi:cellulase family glycosylhydrolase [Lactococcus termiticola]|uniref:Endoglycoceramidase n=1 Tax=Lactococcus termiticola TaxID=2169526 RepID=A0A2R5HH35_9LACT|nr:cellulase family glycosylhydrolase [Lactococcus termiticola]GBG97166.1 hypothetical protein NtB2_01304 [Lactococcus termiticola]
MKKRSKFALAAATALAAASVLLAVPGKADTLHVSGKWMTDDEGRVVLTHGLNAVQKSAPYYPMNVADGMTDKDGQWLQDHGFNAIRLGTLFEGIMPTRGQIDNNYLKNIDRVVKMLAKHNVYTILDFHQDVYNVRWGGDGFPDWAVDTNGIPDIPGMSVFPTSYWQPSTQAAFTNFWNNKNGIMDEYIKAQQAVAGYFKDSPGIMGLELINEPTPGFWQYSSWTPLGNPIFDGTMTASYAKMTKGIRQVAPNMPVLEEPSMLAQAGGSTYLGDAHDSQTVYAFHDYVNYQSLAELYKQLFGPNYNKLLDAASEENLWNLAKGQAEKINGGVQVLSEFGATDNISSLNAVTVQADKNLTGWFYWNYKILGDNSTSGPGEETMFENDADLSTVKLDKLKALEYTYPQATQGTPDAMNFDQKTGAFSYDYTANASKAVTEIYVSPLHYPKNGFNVWATGTTIQSRTSNRITLAPAKAGTKVHVSITAKAPNQGESADFGTDTAKASTAAQAAKPAQAPQPSKPVAVKPAGANEQNIYRLYNKQSQAHLYTSDAQEYANLPKQDKNWQQEGLAWKAPKSGAAVYRVYNAKSGEHIYTNSNYELSSLVKQGWKSEGIAFHSATAKTGKAVYRLYNPKAGIGGHFNTMSSYESQSLQKQGWAYEGIAWYASK